MRKGIKILAKVISIFVLLSIFLPVTLTLVLNVENVQNVVVKRASEFASEYLGARVDIGRIDIDLFSRVRIEGFYVEDTQQEMPLRNLRRLQRSLLRKEEWPCPKRRFPKS